MHVVYAWGVRISICLLRMPDSKMRVEFMRL